MTRTIAQKTLQAVAATEPNDCEPLAVGGAGRFDSCIAVPHSGQNRDALGLSAPHDGQNRKVSIARGMVVISNE